MRTAWRDSGSIVPVKGNSSMATLYKVHTSLCLTFTNMAAASRMSSGQDVQSTPSTRKLAAPPHKPGTGAAGVVVFQACCTDSMHAC